jgi:hypothetical protein
MMYVCMYVIGNALMTVRSQTASYKTDNIYLLLTRKHRITLIIHI